MDGKNKVTGYVQAQEIPAETTVTTTAHPDFNETKTVEMVIAEEQEKIKKAVTDMVITAEETLNLVRNCQIPKLRDKDLCDLLEKVIWKTKAYYK